MTSKRAAVLVVAALAALCGLRLALNLRAQRFADAQTRVARAGNPEYLAMGRGLAREGLMRVAYDAEPRSARRAPLYPYWLGLIRAVAGDPIAPRALRLQHVFLALAVLPVFLLGWRLHSPAAGLLAAAVYAAHPAPARLAASLDVGGFYLLTLLAVAAALPRWLREGDRRSALELGLACALSLCTRSPLVLFPLLAAWLGRGAGTRGVAILLAASYLPLAPWTARNLAAFGEVVPFERAGAGYALYGAALGHALFPEDSTAIGREADREDPGWRSRVHSEGERNLQRLAKRRIAAHPLTYLKGWARRVWNILTAFPALLLLALAGWWRRRGDPSVSGLLALVAYFLAVHSVPTLALRYLDPVLPLLAVLGGLAVAWKLPESDLRPRPLAAAVLIALLAPAYVWGTFKLLGERVAQPVPEAPMPFEAAAVTRRPDLIAEALLRRLAQDGRVDDAAALRELGWLPVWERVADRTGDPAHAARGYLAIRDGSIEGPALASACAETLPEFPPDGIPTVTLHACATLRPKDAKLAADYGVRLLSEGRADEARRRLTRALELDPSLLGATLTLAGLEEQAGNPGRANTLYETALKLAEGQHEPAAAGIARNALGKR